MKKYSRFLVLYAVLLMTFQYVAWCEEANSNNKLIVIDIENDIPIPSSYDEVNYRNTDEQKGSNFVLNETLLTLLIGLGTPLLSVYVAFKLSNGSEKRKTANRLSIMLEILRQEIFHNIQLIEEGKNNINKLIEYKNVISGGMPFLFDEFASILEIISNTRSDYLINGDLTFDEPIGAHVMGSHIRRCDKEIEELHYRLEEIRKYNNEFEKEKITSEIISIENRRKEMYKKFTVLKDRDISKDFSLIHKKIKDEDFISRFTKVKDKNICFKAFSDIYTHLSEFVLIKKPTVYEISEFLKNIVIYEFKEDSLDSNDEIFEEYHVHRVRNKEIYELWKNYYRYKRIVEKVSANKWIFKSKYWNGNNERFIELSSKKLYMEIKEVYENFDSFSELIGNTHLNTKVEKCNEIIQKNKNLLRNLRYKENELEKVIEYKFFNIKLPITR